MTSKQFGTRFMSAIAGCIHVPRNNREWKAVRRCAIAAAVLFGGAALAFPNGKIPVVSTEDKQMLAMVLDDVTAPRGIVVLKPSFK